MTKLLFIALGGACGAVLRFQVSQFVSTKWASAFPWGTYVINLFGSFLLGYLSGKMGTVWMKSDFGLLLGTGVLGGFTTFSTYCYEGLKLFKSKEAYLGLAYLISSLALGVFLACGGFYLATY